MTALDLLDKVFRLAEIACMPGGVNALLRWRPFSVAAFRLVQGLSADEYSFATVIDVGANAGKFTRAALGAWPGVTVIAFEPLIELANSFPKHEDVTGRVEVHNVALGATDGNIAFYPHEYSLSSSPLRVPASIQALYPWARESQPIEVPQRRLDGLLGGRTLERPVLIKLDVQGFELEVLKGAQTVLEKVDAILIEQAFDCFYENQPLFSESNHFLEEAGWRLARPIDWRREGGKIVEGDCLYIRKGTASGESPRLLGTEMMS